MVLRARTPHPFAGFRVLEEWNALGLNAVGGIADGPTAGAGRFVRSGS
jgi:hypothetical protein